MKNKNIYLGIIFIGVAFILIGRFLGDGRNHLKNFGKSLAPKDTKTIISKEDADRMREIYKLKTSQIKETVVSDPAVEKEGGHTKTSFRNVKFLYNYDGDTITVTIPGVHPLLGEKISVRVLGVDTPERKGNLPCEKERALEAKYFVETRLSNARVINLENVGRDKYFRILADVRFDGKSLSEEILKNDLGVPYFGKTKENKNWCKRK